MDSRHPALARRAQSLLVVIDMQERLFPVIHEREAVQANVLRLLGGARILDVPVLVSEQYPKGLGMTIAPIRDAARSATVLEKTAFSCGGDPAIVEAVRRFDRDTLVIAGIEAHICVLQTALDFQARGFSVHVVADAVSSRSPMNRAAALARLARAGVQVTCAESVLFEWLEAAGSDAFRQVQGLLK